MAGATQQHSPPAPASSVHFREEREADWRALENLIIQIESRGLISLNPADAARLPELYRATLSSLSVARSISLDRNVTEYLENLCLRAELCMRSRRLPGRKLLKDLFVREIPGILRELHVYILLSISFLIIGAVGAAWTVQEDPGAYSAFVPAEMSDGRHPAAPSEILRNDLFSHESGSQLLLFSQYLFDNNSRVAVLSYLLGFLGGVPSALLMIDNGGVLGAISALYHDRGLAVEWWSWVLPHGVPEFYAIVLAVACGLAIGAAVVWPGKGTRLQNLIGTVRRTAPVMGFAIVLLLIAAVIEGVFRQIVHNLYLRYTAALLMFLFCIYYTAIAGRRGRRAEGTVEP